MDGNRSRCDDESGGAAPSAAGVAAIPIGVVVVVIVIGVVIDEGKKVCFPAVFVASDPEAGG